MLCFIKDKQVKYITEQDAIKAMQTMAATNGGEGFSTDDEALAAFKFLLRASDVDAVIAWLKERKDKHHADV